MRKSMAIGRNARRRLTASPTIIGRAAASVLLPFLARVEFRPRDDLAGSPAVRLFPGPVQRRDRTAVRGPGVRAGAAQPGRGRLYRPDRRATHPARLVGRDGGGWRVVRVRAGLLDAA